jgi:SAM-dependent methyltransferase
MVAQLVGQGRIEAELERIYSNRFSPVVRRSKVRTWKTLCDAFLSRYVPPRGTVLDLGAGSCEFINQIRARRRIAIDLNPDTLRLAEPGVEVLSIPLEQTSEAIAPESVDLAFASNVFEHLPGPDALLHVLEAIHQILRPGGRLIIMQPNVAALGGRFWDFVDHTLPLTEKGMAEALEVSRFEVLECRARFLPYTFKSRLPAWPWLVHCYLALPPAHWLFGKQMFLVARRPRVPSDRGIPIDGNPHPG